MAIDSDGQFKLAKYLNKGDSIVTYDFERNEQVLDTIESVLIEPVASYVGPLTMAGTILVDGVLASSYAVIHNHDLAHASMAPLRWWYQLNNLLGQFAPNVVPANLQFEKQMNGTHWYPQMLHSFTQQYLNKIVNLD
jgi:hypothetical protein